MFNWKFWEKGKKTSPPAEEAIPIEEIKPQDTERLRTIERRKMVLEWRDRHEIRIEIELSTFTPIL